MGMGGLIRTQHVCTYYIHTYIHACMHVHACMHACISVRCSVTERPPIHTHTDTYKPSEIFSLVLLSL